MMTRLIPLAVIASLAACSSGGVGEDSGATTRRDGGVSTDADGFATVGTPGFARDFFVVMRCME